MLAWKQHLSTPPAVRACGLDTWRQFKITTWIHTQCFCCSLYTCVYVDILGYNYMRVQQFVLVQNVNATNVSRYYCGICASCWNRLLTNELYTDLVCQLVVLAVTESHANVRVAVEWTKFVTERAKQLDTENSCRLALCTTAVTRRFALCLHMYTTAARTPLISSTAFYQTENCRGCNTYVEVWYCSSVDILLYSFDIFRKRVITWNRKLGNL